MMSRGLLCIVLALIFKDVATEECNTMVARDGELVIPGGCKEGYVDWIKPQGSLTLKINRDEAMTVCLEAPYLEASIQEIYDETDGNKKLAVPTKDNPTCVSDSDGELILIVMASSQAVYFDSFKYTVS